MANDPVKCPDCGTWWRGDEHRCPPRPQSGQPAYPLPPYTGGGGGSGVYRVGERGAELFTTNVPLANVRLHEVQP